MPTNSTKRRLALKTLGGSALAGGLADKLPAIWQRPLVESSILPAHAQVSEAGQIQLVISDLANPQRRLSVSLAYQVRRNTNDRITGVIFPAVLAQVTEQDAPLVYRLWRGLFPAAYAQTASTSPAPEETQAPPAPQATPAPQIPPLRLLRDVELDFSGGATQASGMLNLSYDGFNCVDFEISVTLIPDRTGIRRIDPGAQRTNCGTAYSIAPGTGTDSGFGSVIGPTGIPVIPTSTEPTAAPTQAPEVEQIRVDVTDTTDPNTPVATLTFNYNVGRDAASQIDQIVFPAATFVGLAVHQPDSGVLAALLPAAYAQTGELRLTDTVTLMFNDTDLDQTATLELSYNDAPCTGSFDVEITLYAGRQSIQEVTGTSNNLDCGTDVTIAANTGPDSGFGTRPPPPTPGPTTTAGPTMTPGPTMTSGPTTTLERTLIGFADAGRTLSVVEGGTLSVRIRATGRSAATFNMVRVADSSVAQGTDLAPLSPFQRAGATLALEGDRYDLIGLTIENSEDEITIPIRPVNDGDDEDTENLTFRLEEARNPDPGHMVDIDPDAAQITIAIADADRPLVQFAQSEYMVHEGETLKIEFEVDGWASSKHFEDDTNDSVYTVGFIVTRDANPAISNDFMIEGYGGNTVVGTVRPRNMADDADQPTDAEYIHVALVRQIATANAGADIEYRQYMELTATRDMMTEADKTIVFVIDPDLTRTFTSSESVDPPEFTYQNSDIRVGPRNTVTIRLMDPPPTTMAGTPITWYWEFAEQTDEFSGTDLYWIQGSFTTTVMEGQVIGQRRVTGHTFIVYKNREPLYTWDVSNAMLTLPDGSTEALTGQTADFSWRVGDSTFDPDYIPPSNDSFRGVNFFADTPGGRRIAFYYSGSAWTIQDTTGNEALTYTARTIDGIPTVSETPHTLPVPFPPPPTTSPAPTTTGGLSDTFNYSISVGGNTVTGRFVLKSTITVVAGTTIDEGDLLSHTLTVANSGGTELFVLDLVNDTLSKAGGTAAAVAGVEHDFQYTLGATNFLNPRTDDLATANIPVNLRAGTAPDRYGLYFVYIDSSDNDWNLLLGSDGDMDDPSQRTAIEGDFSALTITPA